MFGQEGGVRLRLRSPWKHLWGFPDGDGGNGTVGGGAACAKAPGYETRCLLGKHKCPFLPASFLTSRLSPCHHPRPLHSVLQTEAARTDFLKCESDHVSLSLLQNLLGLLLPLKTNKEAKQTLSIFPCPASPGDLA